MFKRKIKAELGNYVEAKTKQGAVKGVLVPFRGKKVVETRSGIQDVQEVMHITPTQNLSADTQHFVKAVRFRHDLS
jgi:hypothetical protein